VENNADIKELITDSMKHGFTPKTVVEINSLQTCF